MPDHAHVLAEASQEDADLRRFVARWKQLTGYEWKRRTGQRLWQKGYYDHVVRDEEPTAAIISYIVGNPVRAGLVHAPDEYPLSGPSNYAIEDLFAFDVRRG